MTIFYPYPQHANMEVEDDVERVARWLGSIVQPRYFNAFYHKPSVSTIFRLFHEIFSPVARPAPLVTIHVRMRAEGVCPFSAHLCGSSQMGDIVRIIENVRY